MAGKNQVLKIYTEQKNSLKIGKTTQSLESFVGLNVDAGSQSEANSKILVIDKSSSMNMSIGGVSKWDHLLHAINLHFGNSEALCVVFAGSTLDIQTISVQELPHVKVGGGTAMDIAFDTIIKNKYIGHQLKSVIAVSDGETFDENKAIDKAKELNVLVDTIYIGDDNSPGHTFMKRLSQITGGASDIVNENVTSIKLLERKIAGLLGPIGGGAIQL